MISAWWILPAAFCGAFVGVMAVAFCKCHGPECMECNDLWKLQNQLSDLARERNKLEEALYQARKEIRRMGGKLFLAHKEV